MKLNNNLNSNLKLILISLFIGGTGLLMSCNENEKFSKTYDISLNKDNSIVATLEKNEDEYSLTIKGKGEIKSFGEEDTPWKDYNSSIKKIIIEEGIETIGAYTFNEIEVDYVFLPSTVKTLKTDAFKEKTTLYSYGNEIEGTSKYKTYYFEEEKPVENNKYWRMVNDVPTVWKTDNLRALFVGNSFTFFSDIPKLTQKIAQSLDYTILTDSVTRGGWTLAQFADDKDFNGMMVTTKLKETDNYDFMILQDHSLRPVDNYQLFLEGCIGLNEKAALYQKECKVRLYETWGYQSEATKHGWTIPEMENELCKAYDKAGEEIGAKVHYVGKAFTKIFEEYKNINIYDNDNKHPNYAGSYLSALIHVGSMLENVDLTEVTFNGELDSETANTLKEVANQIIRL